MKEYFVTCLFLGVSMLTITSCQKDFIEEESKIIESKRCEKTEVKFKTTSELVDTYLKLSLCGDEEKQQWLDSVEIKEPLVNWLEICSDSSMLDAPMAFQMLFNKDMKVQIGDTIARYNRGKIIVESVLGKEVKDNIVLATICITKENVDKDLPSSRANVSGDWVTGKTGWIGSRHIPIKIYSDSEHKYIHEFRTISIADSRGLIQQLFFDIKFHYKKRQGWREATGENRQIGVDLKIDVQNVQGGGIYWKKNYSTKNRIEYPICWASMSLVHQFNGKWNISCIGKITHMVDGFPNSKRIDEW